MILRSTRLRYTPMLTLLATAPAFAQHGTSTNAAAVPPRPTVQAERGDGVPRGAVAVSPELALQTTEPPQLSSPSKVTHRWYGWQTLSTDGVAIASFILAGTMEESTFLPAVGVGSYIFGGPSVHAAHDNWGRSALSFGMRTVFPVATGGVFYALNSCEPPGDEDSDSGGWCELGRALAAVFGGALGATVAMALDASLLAWEPEEVRPQFAPAIGVTKTSAWLGVAGQF